MKQIKQWFKGLIIIFVGGLLFIYSIFGTIGHFIEMMNVTGKTFVEHFIFFIICLLLFIFAPYLFVEGIKDNLLAD